MMTAILVAGAFALWILSGLRYIENDPPHIGLITFFGRRLPITVCEGWRVLPWPLGAITENITIRDYDLPVVVRTRDGAAVTVPIKIHVRPNPERLIDWFDAGRDEGVRQKTLNICEEATRELTTRHTDWAELQESHELDDALIFRLTGHHRHELQGTENEFPMLDWPGGRLANLEVGQIVLDPNSDAARAAGRKAEEEARRRGEAEKLAARLERAGKIAKIVQKKTGKPLQETEMFALIKRVIEDEQVDIGKAQKHILEIPAIAEAIAKAPELMKELAQLIRDLRRQP